jgi:hypothetical protein
MRIEGRDQRRPPVRAGARHRPPDHRLVPEMEAVEIAQRDDPARQMLGDNRAPVQALHGRAIKAAAPLVSPPWTGRGWGWVDGADL